MPNNKPIGDRGEIEVIELVRCPNCSKKLMTLPANYPLYDVQCTGCSFRAQIKTNHTKPKNTIFGAGWDILEKVLKSGFTVPPLIANFHWDTGHEIRFYPFIPKHHLNMRILSPTARRANYKMFNYVKLDKLPFFVLFSSRK